MAQLGLGPLHYPYHISFCKKHSLPSTDFLIESVAMGLKTASRFSGLLAQPFLRPQTSGWAFFFFKESHHLSLLTPAISPFAEHCPLETELPNGLARTHHVSDIAERLPKPGKRTQMHTADG